MKLYKRLKLINHILVFNVTLIIFTLSALKCKIKIDYCHVRGANKDLFRMLLFKVFQFGKHHKLNGPLTDFDVYEGYFI